MSRLSLAGCTDLLSVRSAYTLSNRESGHMHFNAAEMRAIVSVPRSGDAGPRFITCAEPSPDIAKVFGTAAGLAGSFSEPKTGTQAALAASLSRAQAAAQLGERLATIQLLRDVLYRA